jgi:hypothetical protein
MSDTTIQQATLSRWVATLSKIPEVEVIWLEGSLVDGTKANPGSDIDIRLGIADYAYERLWGHNKTEILSGLGNILRLIDSDWIRALTAEGVIVEIAVSKTSELDGRELDQWRFLLNRLPVGKPAFCQLPRQSPGETWTEREPLTSAFVWNKTEIALAALANCPGPFYNNEYHSARFTLDSFRTELVKLMYRQVGVYFAKRYKHLSEILPPEFLTDLEYTYLAPAALPLDPAALADATLRLFEMTGKHLQQLSDRAGGGFEPEWYWQLHRQVGERLVAFLDSIEAHPCVSS